MNERTLEIVQKNEEQLLTAKIEAVRSASNMHALKPICRCHNCGEGFEHHDPLREERKFCDEECEGEWEEWFQAMKRRIGSHFTPRSAFNYSPAH